MLSTRNGTRFVAAAALSASALGEPPVRTEDARLLPQGGTERETFGASVAMEGTTAVIGAPGSGWPITVSGAAYVFSRGPGGEWTQVDKLFGSASPANDLFGESVSISGDRILVGSPFAPDGFASGEAHVFVRGPGGEWTREAILTASDAHDSARFGWSVSLEDDTAVMTGRTLLEQDQPIGGVYVFTRRAGGWTQEQILVADDGVYLGANEPRIVSLSGDMIAAGAPFDHTHGDQAGSVYIFRRGPDGVWSQDAKLVPDGIAEHNLFGTSVELVGDAVLVGAPDFNYPFPGLTGGAAYVFTRDAKGQWHEERLPDPADLATEHLFGRAVAFDGQTALIGQATSGASGWVYAYRRDGNGAWSQRVKFVNSLTDAEGLGLSMALADGWGIMGTRFDGEVDLFAGAALGYRLAEPCVGDLNRDGRVDQHDIGVLAGHFGRTGVGTAGGDLDASGVIDFGDVAELVAAISSPCAPAEPMPK